MEGDGRSSLPVLVVPPLHHFLDPLQCDPQQVNQFSLLCGVGQSCSLPPGQGLVQPPAPATVTLLAFGGWLMMVVVGHFAVELSK